MKIVFAIKALNDISGGAERVFADVTSALCDRDHEVIVLTFDPEDGESFYTLNPKIKRICLGIGNVHRKSTIGETIKRILRLRQTIRAERPDVAVGFMHSMFVPLSLSMIFTGIPIVASEHIVPDHYKDRKIEFLLLLLSSIFFKKVTVLSEKIKKTYPTFLQNKIIPISNPVQFPETIAKVTTNKKCILNVGRLDPQKDQKTLINAFSHLAHKYPDWNLRIIGEGSLREDLEKQINSLKLSERISLPGRIQDISQEYQNSDIFAMSSRYESFGLATAEAMAHELPAIGFIDCPGTNEIILHEKNGLLIDNKDREQSMTDALERLIKDEEARKAYGRFGRESVRHYSIEHIIKKWEDALFSSNDITT